MSIKENTIKNFAKAYYDVSNATKRFEDIARNKEVKHKAKYLINGFANKTASIIRDTKLFLSEENRKIFQDEIETYETLSFEAVYDAMVLMSPQQREQLESVAIGLIKETQTV